MDETFDSEFDISVTSNFSNLPGSTPRKQSTKNVWKKPKQPRQQNPVVATCQLCGKKYRSLKYYQKHAVYHKLKDASSNFPTAAELSRNSSDIISSGLNKMATSRVIGEDGQHVRNLVTSLLNNPDEFQDFNNAVLEKFSSKLNDVKFCLPSAIHKNIQAVISATLSDCAFRKWTLQTSLSRLNASDSAVHSFVSEFMFVLGDKIIHFVRERVLETAQSTVSPNAVSINTNERQAMHYVAGSIIRQYLRKSMRFKNNRYWQSIEKAIKRCILEGDRVVAAEESDRYWTEFCNRGALNFVGASFMDFIVEVVHLLISVERPDGSLLDADVQRELLSSPARSLWDRMLEDAMDEDDSIIFMQGVVRAFTATYGRGSCLKRMNEAMQTPEATVSLRRRLAK